MKRMRFAAEQIVAILKQAELGIPIAELIRQVGVWEQTFYRWKKKYSGLEVHQVRQRVAQVSLSRPAVPCLVSKCVVPPSWASAWSTNKGRNSEGRELRHAPGLPAIGGQGPQLHRAGVALHAKLPPDGEPRISG
jgi:hypothetical protein